MLSSRNRELFRINRYLWISVAFVAVWLVGHAQTFGAHQRSVLGWLFGIGFSSVATRSYVAYRSQAGTTGHWGWLFTSIDIAVLAGAVHNTGGLRSDLWLMYFLLLITETLGASAKAELLLTTLVVFGYTAGLWPIRDWGTFFTHLFFLYITVAIARRLARGAEERNRQLALLNEQLSLEREKGRVARELHDGIGREIVNVILSLEVARRVAQKSPEEVPELIGESITILRGAMDDTRQLIFHTRPVSLDSDSTETLKTRVERYARQFADRTGISVSVDCTDCLDIFDAPVAFGALRITQEALNNIAKHAQATQVAITLRSENGFLIGAVTDDGRGFDMSQNRPGTGIGLSAMRERAQELKGDVQIHSAPGAGTRVQFRLPLR